jgi:hypothetical protein
MIQLDDAHSHCYQTDLGPTSGDDGDDRIDLSVVVVGRDPGAGFTARVP